MKHDSNIARLASAIESLANCVKAPRNEFGANLHSATIESIMRKAPHGGGIDGDVLLDEKRSNRTRVVITAEIHRMNPGGFYDGWCTATVTIRPSFSGIDVDVTGKGLDEGWKDHLADTFRWWATTVEVVSQA